MYSYNLRYGSGGGGGNENNNNNNNNNDNNCGGSSNSNYNSNCGQNNNNCNQTSGSSNEYGSSAYGSSSFGNRVANMTSGNYSYGGQGGSSGTGAAKNFTSQVESALINSSVPVPTSETEEINVNGQRGILLNKSEISSFRGTLPLEKYPINQDPCPQIIKKKAQNVDMVQEVGIKFFKPKHEPPGKITIKQEPNRNIDPAPPVIIRQVAPPAKNGGVKVLREQPPCLPKAPGEKVIFIPGKLNPPPPRKVIIEKLACLPPKPDSIFVERWLDADPVKRLVKFEPAPKPPCVEKPRNIIIEWEAGQTNIKQEIKVLGVVDFDPCEYRKQHQDLLAPNQLPEFAQRIQPPNGQRLAVNGQKVFYELEGDIQALRFVDLDKEGLGEYKEYLARLGIHYTPVNQNEIDTSVQYCQRDDNCVPQTQQVPCPPQPTYC